MAVMIAHYCDGRKIQIMFSSYQASQDHSVRRTVQRVNRSQCQAFQLYFPDFHCFLSHLSHLVVDQTGLASGI